MPTPKIAAITSAPLPAPAAAVSAPCANAAGAKSANPASALNHMLAFLIELPPYELPPGGGSRTPYRRAHTAATHYPGRAGINSISALPQSLVQDRPPGAR